MSSVIDTVRALLVEQIEIAEENLLTMRADLELLRTSPKTVEYRATLRSSWAGEGERDVTRVAATVSEAVRLACGMFKVANSRSDVQATCVVTAVPNSGREIVVPERWWRSYYERYRQAAEVAA
jgi:hypothetical protein